MTTRVRYTGEYLYPGALFPEEIFRPLSAPTLEAAVAEGPDEDGYFTKDGWYAVRIKAITEKRFRSEDGEERWLVDGDPARYSIIVGRRVHWNDPELAGDEHAIIRANIQSNSKDGYGVLTRIGNWQIASDWDEVVTL